MSTRTVVDFRDWDECSILAQSAVDLALARINTDSRWRSTMTNGGMVGPITLGRGKVWYRLTDSTDGQLDNNVVDPVDIVAVARVGRAARALQLQAAPANLAALEALQCSVYAGSGLNVNGNFTVSGGPAATGGLATVGTGGNLTGNLDAALLVRLGTVSGSATSPASSRTMPSSAVYDSYLAQATAISYSSLPMGVITTGILSPNWDPYGAKNAKGIYSIDVPAGSTLTIRTCRLVATLVVNLGVGSKISVVNSVVWDPPSSTQPSLIVRATATGTVDLAGSSTALSESSWNYNFNPSHTPYQGTSNSTKSDSFPSELHGLFHVIGALTTTNLGSNLKVVGGVISEGTVAVTGGGSVRLDSGLGASPPIGYWSGGALTVVRGTWQWAEAP